MFKVARRELGVREPESLALWRRNERQGRKKKNMTYRIFFARDITKSGKGEGTRAKNGSLSCENGKVLDE